MKSTQNIHAVEIDMAFVEREAGDRPHTEESRLNHQVVREELGDEFYSHMIQLVLGVVLPAADAKRVWFGIARERVRLVSNNGSRPSFNDAVRVIAPRVQLRPAEPLGTTSMTGFWTFDRLDRELGTWSSALTSDQYGVVVIPLSNLVGNHPNIRLTLRQLAVELREIIAGCTIFGHASNGDLLIFSDLGGQEVRFYGARLERWLQKKVFADLDTLSVTVPKTASLLHLEHMLGLRSQRALRSSPPPLRERDVDATG